MTELSEIPDISQPVPWELSAKEAFWWMLDNGEITDGPEIEKHGRWITLRVRSPDLGRVLRALGFPSTGRKVNAEAVRDVMWIATRI